MHIYGYLKKGKNRYPISSHVVTFGALRDNDIRVLNPNIKAKHAKLDIRPKSSNGADGNDFVLQVFSEGPITVNGKSTPVNEDIILCDQDEICFANNKFQLQIENVNQNLAEINQNVPAKSKQDVAATKNGPTSYSVYPKFYSSSSKPRRSSGRLSLAKKVPSVNKTPRRSRRFSSLYPVIDQQKDIDNVTATTNASFVTAFDETIAIEETDDEINQNEGTINLDSTPEKTQPDDDSQFETPNQTVVNVGGNDSLSIIEEESNGVTKMSGRSETIMVTSTPCPDMTTYATPRLVLATKSRVSKSSPALLEPGFAKMENFNKDLIKSALKTPSNNAVILNSAAKSVKFSEFSIQKVIQEETKMLVPTKLFDGEFPEDDVSSTGEGYETPVNTPVLAKKSSARKNFPSRIPVMTPTRTYSRTPVTTPASTSKVAKRITPTRVMETKSPTVTPKAACLKNVSELQKLIQATDHIADYDSNIDLGSETLIEPKTPTVPETNESMTNKLIEPTTLADCESNVDFELKELTKPGSLLAQNDANVLAIREIPQAPTPKADYQTNVDFGLKKLTQPKTPAADYESNVDYALKKMNHPTPKADYEKNVDFGIKKLTQPVTPRADYESNIGGIKKLTQPTTPKADYKTNVDFGVKKMLELGTPKADYDTNLDWGLKKLIQPGTPEADYEKNVDIGLNKMLAPSTPDADYGKNVDFGLRQLYSIHQTEPASGYDANMTGIGKMMRSPNESPKANYSVNVSTVGLLFAEEEQEHEPSNNSNELENNKDVDTSKTSLVTPSRKKVTEALSSRKATPIVKRTNTTSEEQVTSKVDTNANVEQSPKVSEVACEIIAPKSTRKQRVNKVILELVEQDTPQKALRSSPRSARKAQTNILNQSEVIFTPKSSNKRAQVNLVDKEFVQKLEVFNESDLLENLIHTNDTLKSPEKNDDEKKKHGTKPHLSMLEESVPTCHSLDVGALVELEPKSDADDGEEQKLIDTSTPQGEDIISTTSKSSEMHQSMTENFVSDELEPLVSGENLIQHELVQEVEKTESELDVDLELETTQILLSTSKSVKNGRKSNEFIVTPSKPIDIAEVVQVVVDETEAGSNEQEEFVLNTPSKTSAKKQRKSAEFIIELTPLESTKKSLVVAKSAKKSAAKSKAQESEISAAPKSTIKSTPRGNAGKVVNHGDDIVESKPIERDELLSGDSEVKSREIINEVQDVAQVGVDQTEASSNEQEFVLITPSKTSARKQRKSAEFIIELTLLESKKKLTPDEVIQEECGEEKIDDHAEHVFDSPVVVAKSAKKNAAKSKTSQESEISATPKSTFKRSTRGKAGKVVESKLIEEDELLSGDSEVKSKEIINEVEEVAQIQKSVKKRGRVAKPKQQQDIVEQTNSELAEPQKSSRKRSGRTKAVVHEEEDVEPEPQIVPKKKTRGRSTASKEEDAEIEPETPVKGRGRSRKVAAKVEPPEEEDVLESKPRRGRRAKVIEEEEDSSVTEPKSAPKTRGKRGAAAIHDEESTKEAIVAKKTRGRKAVVVDEEPEIEPETPAKGRGRTRKAATKVEPPEEEVLEVKPKRGRRKVANDDLGELVGFDTEETRKKASHAKMVSKFSEQNDNISGTRRTRGRGAAASNLQPKDKNAIDGLLEGVDILDADGEHFMDVIEESKKTKKNTTSTRGRRGKNIAAVLDQPKSSTTLKRKATKLNESIESNESNLAKSNSDSSLQSSSNDDVAAPPQKKVVNKRPTFVLPKVAIPVGVEYKDGMEETPEKANNRVTRSRNRRY